MGSRDLLISKGSKRRGECVTHVPLRGSIVPGSSIALTAGDSRRTVDWIWLSLAGHMAKGSRDQPGPLR